MIRDNPKRNKDETYRNIKKKGHNHSGHPLEVIFTLEALTDKQPLNKLLPIPVDTCFVFFTLLAHLFLLILLPGGSDNLRKLLAHHKTIVHGMTSALMEIEANYSVGAIDI